MYYNLVDLKIKDSIEWLAGLLDGEGCFQLSNGSSPQIVIQMTDEDVIKRVAELWNGNYSKIIVTNPYHSNLFVTRIYSINAIEWMIKVYPFMGSRRKLKIKEIVNYYNLYLEKKNFCLKGHDKRIVGRCKDGCCKACMHEYNLNRKNKKKSTIFFKTTPAGMPAHSTATSAH